MAKSISNEPISTIVDRELNDNNNGMDILLARELVYLEIMLGKSKVEAKYVKVILNGINKMGYFKPNEWSSKCGGQRLTVEEMTIMTKRWLRKNYVLDKVKDRLDRNERFDKIIESIPNFDKFLLSIFHHLPLDLNHKLPKMKPKEEKAFVFFVYKAIKGCYFLTKPEKKKRNFTVNKFNILVGYIIKKFLYDFPGIGINNLDQLGKKVNSAVYNSDPREIITF
jgi:hypothetical protein